MQNSAKSRDELIRELRDLRQRLVELEAAKQASASATDVTQAETPVETRHRGEDTASAGSLQGMSSENGVRRFHEVFEQACDAAYLHNLDGQFVDVNCAACRQLGYARDELLSMSVSDVDPDAANDPISRPTWQAVAAGRSATIESRHHRKDGTCFPVEVRLNLVRVKGEKLVLAIARDISERKQAEELLRTSERKLSNAMKIARLGYWEYDATTNLFTFDDHFYAIFRTSVEEVGGYTMSPDEYARRFLHPDDMHLVAQEMQRALNASEPQLSRQLEHRIRYADGETGYVAVRYFIVMDEQKRTIKTYGANQDVTERHKAEEDLRVAKQKAEAASLAKSEFLANMSHEIRTPMTAILGFADLLIDGFAANEDALPEHLDAATTIRRNGEYLLELINGILDLSKIEAGKLEVEQVECSPHRVIAEVRELMQVRANAAGIALRVESLGPLPATIQTDPLRLRQILINIIGNAIKFTDFGNVTLRTHCDRERSIIEFDVVDTGVGMSSTQAAGLFTPFSQADSTAARRFKGTGLGLTISRRLARLLGGDVRIVETAPGQGSRFRITVTTGPINNTPVQNDIEAEQTCEPKASDVTSKRSVEPLGGMRVLLAEDGPDNQRLVGHILRKAGAQVTIAENGRLAIDATIAALDAAKPFDVILMDMQMPDMDGYAATRELRNRRYAGAIIALTANTMEQYRTQCFEVGCNDFLAKPFHRDKLIEILARHRPEQVAD